jgi:hypothetical protein
MTITACQEGFKIGDDGLCNALEPNDAQTVIENCLEYSTDYSTESVCIRCQPGYDFLTHTLMDLSSTASDTVFRLCLERPQNIHGCQGNLDNGSCMACNAELGYWADSVEYTRSPVEAQPMICKNTQGNKSGTLEKI